MNLCNKICVLSIKNILTLFHVASEPFYFTLGEEESPPPQRDIGLKHLISIRVPKMWDKKLLEIQKFILSNIILDFYIFFCKIYLEKNPFKINKNCILVIIIENLLFISRK